MTDQELNDRLSKALAHWKLWRKAMQRACSFILCVCCWAVCASVWWVLLPISSLQKVAGMLADDAIDGMKSHMEADNA